MTDWGFVLVPLLVLPIVLLFRFVGCEEPKPEDEIIATKGPSYKDTILAEASVIAYWRLVDGQAETKAKDEKALSPSLDGDYKVVPGLPPEIPNNTSPGSEAANGAFTTGVDSLIASDFSAKCRAFNGGYVIVAGFAKTTPLSGAAEVPYPENFTVEAWIHPQWTQQSGYEHTLLGAGGFYRAPFDQSPDFHGFRIFADRDDRWQIYLAPGGVVKMEAAPIVAHDKTHLAVTVGTTAPSKKQVTLFLNGKQFGQGTADVYSPPHTAPLFIGVSNRESDPSKPPQPRYPVLSPIQEVVLYKTVLPSEVIKKHHDAGT